jgi:aspartate kinase
MGDATDRILRLAGHAGGGAAGRELDRALATGEDLSAALVAAALRQRGIEGVSLRGGEAGIVAAGPHGAGTVARVEPARLLALLARGAVPVVSGFQGVGEGGETVTLGRGGSDTTAIALAGAIGAACHIVTDVDAVYDADPRGCDRATPYATLSHDELVALAASGARVLHLGAALLARDWSVPFRVYGYRAPFGRRTGTVVGGRAPAAPAG